MGHLFGHIRSFQIHVCCDGKSNKCNHDGDCHQSDFQTVRYFGSFRMEGACDRLEPMIKVKWDSVESQGQAHPSSKRGQHCQDDQWNRHRFWRLMDVFLRVMIHSRLSVECEI